MNTFETKFAPLVKRGHYFRARPLRMRILQVFLNADLRGSHNSLILTGKTYGLQLDKLTENQAVIFINKKKTLMKVYVTGNTFSFTRRERIDLEAIKHLPEAFGATGEFDYDKALEKSLTERPGMVH